MDVKVLRLAGCQGNQTYIYKIFTDLSDRVLKLESATGELGSQSLCYPLLAAIGLPAGTLSEPEQSITGEALMNHLQSHYPEQNLQLINSQVVTLAQPTQKPNSDRRCIAAVKRVKPGIPVAV